MMQTMLKGLVLAVGAVALVGCATDDPNSSDNYEFARFDDVTSARLRSDLRDVAIATAKYNDLSVAQAGGWNLVPGLDHCFNNQPTGAMGYHYINLGKLDLTVEKLAPESFVYHRTSDGELKFGAVEYIVPAAPWDEAHPGELPMALDQHMHLNAALGVYVLHAWIWTENPRGTLQDWNSAVSCP